MRRVTLVLLALIAVHAMIASAADAHQLEMGYLLHFAHFVEWPESVLPPAAPIVIGIVGNDPFGRLLDERVMGKRVSGHPLRVRRLHWNDSLTGCQMLFVSSSDRDHLNAILDATRGFSVLTVADVDTFTERGGMIELVALHDRIDFDVNTEALAEAHLKISAGLLQLARAIRSTVAR